MLSRGLIAWTVEPHGRDLAKALFMLGVILLPFMAVAAPGGIIAADLCLLGGWIAGLIARRRSGQKLDMPIWGWWAIALLFPYLLVMLLGRDRLLLPLYPLSLLQHLYSPLFAVLLVYGIHVHWPGRAGAVLFRGLALSGLIVVVMDLLIFGLAITGLYVFTPAFRDGIFNSRLEWPFAQPSQLPGFLLVTFPLSAFWLFDLLVAKRGVLLAALVLLLNVIAHAVIAAMSGSRAGAATVILECLGIVGLAFLRVPRGKWPLLTIMLLASIAAAVWGLMALSESNWVVRRSLQVFSDAMTGASVVSTDFRAHNWEFARRLFLESPLFGAGLTASIVQYGYEIHNTYLGAFAELGILGGVTIVALLLGLPAYVSWQVIVHRGKLPESERIVPLLLALGGTAILASTHYMLRQRWVWLAIVFMFQLLAESRDRDRSASEDPSLCKGVPIARPPDTA